MNTVEQEFTDTLTALEFQRLLMQGNERLVSYLVPKNEDRADLLNLAANIGHTRT